MKMGEFNVTLEKVETNIKNSYEFLKFFVNFHTFLKYHNTLLEIYFIHTLTGKKLPNFLKFRNCPCNTNFLPLFPSADKTLRICNSYYDQPSVRSKLSWVDICTVNSFYCWFFMLKGFRVLRSSNSVLGSKLSEDVLELVSAMM